MKQKDVSSTKCTTHKGQADLHKSIFGELDSK